jgi:hypothetical protein
MPADPHCRKNPRISKNYASETPASNVLAGVANYGAIGLD